MTPNAFLTHTGPHDMYRDSTGTLYVLKDRTGATVGTYPSARAAMDASLAIVVATFKASK